MEEKDFKEETKEVEDKKEQEEPKNYVAEIEFNQTLTKNDVVEFNYYLLNSKISTWFFIAVLIVMPLILGILSIVQKNYDMLLPACIFFAIGMLMYPIQRIIIEFSAKRKLKEDEIFVKVGACEEGLMYNLIEDENSRIIPWTSVSKVVSNNQYMYIHVDRYSVIILKKANCESIDAFEDYVKQRIMPNIKYIEKQKNAK